MGGTFNVELEVTSKNGKKFDVTSESITVIDVCYKCAHDDSSISSRDTFDICASLYFTKADFDFDLVSYESSDYDCTKK